MAGKGPGFEGGAEDIAGKLRLAASRSKDIATNIDKIKDGWNFFAAKTESINKNLGDLNKRLSVSQKAMSDAAAAGSSGYVTLAGHVADLTQEIDKMNKKLLMVRAGEKVAQGFDKLGRSLLKVHETIMSFGFGFLVDGIKRVYELQERWTRAIGEFNMKLGGMSAGLKGAQKAAVGWEGTVRGLTDQFGQGLQMFAEFTTGISRMVENGDDFSKFGLQLARGFNLGAESAGRLSRSFENMNMNSGQAAITMSQLVDAANDARVPVNMVAKDVAEANDYLVRFGKQGAKAFVTAAGYARRFGLSMKDLQKSVEGFDMLEGATTMAAKFNVAFGTAINGIDILLEDDPARRMETFRKSLLSQGKTFESMSPKMRRMAADMLKVNETQLAALLNNKDAGESYQKMMDKQAKKEKNEIESKAMMQKALAKTAQTMFAFGAAWDRVTVAIGRAIRPLLETLGLAKSGGKEWKSFGQVMGDIFGTIEHFFNELATNPKWNSFMKELANDLLRAGGALKDFVMSGGAVKLIGKIVTVTQELYKWGKSAFETMVDWGKKLMPVVEFIYNHSKQILSVWMGMKAMNFVAGSSSKLSEMLSVGGKTSGAGKAIGKAGGVLGAAAMGAGIGSVTGDGVSGAVGGAAGGALGMALGGPIGAAVGSAVGGWLASKGVEVWNIWKESQLSDEELYHKYRLKNLEEEKRANLRAIEANAKLNENIDAARISRDQIAKAKFDSHVAALGADTGAIQYITKEFNALQASTVQQRKLIDEQVLEALQKKKNDEEVELKTAEAKADRLDAEFKEKDMFSDLSKVSVKSYADMKKAQDRSLDSEEALADAHRSLAKTEYQMLKVKQIMGRFEKDFASFSADPTNAGMSFNEQQIKFFNKMFLEGKVSRGDAQSVVDFQMGRFAAGGIVRRPTQALIGENGPEAVIPLRSIGRGRTAMPKKFGGETAKQMVNYATGKTTQQSGQTTFVAGDVYLDGAKVGRHIVRQALTGRE